MNKVLERNGNNPTPLIDVLRKGGTKSGRLILCRGGVRHELSVDGLRVMPLRGRLRTADGYGPCGPEEAGATGRADRQQLRHDRPRHLLRALGADVEAGRGIDLGHVLLGGLHALLGQVGEEAVEALAGASEPM